MVVAVLGQLAKPTKSIYLTLTLLSLPTRHRVSVQSLTNSLIPIIMNPND